MEKYKKILNEHGIKPTFQRIKILEYLDHNKNHPTVDMIYSALFKSIPTLSKTTVYNTLDVLRKKGLVSVLSSTEIEARYEYNFDFHHHFICRKCGKIIDIPISCILRDQLEAEGYKIEEVHGNFLGICKDCNQSEK